MRATTGYTLLEMVVVLAILALATGLAAPIGYRMIDSWQESEKLERLAQTIADMPMRARREGQPLEFRQKDGARLSRELALPEGWALNLDTPWVIRSNGACLDSEGTLVTGRGEHHVAIQSPFCRLKIEANP